MPNHVFQLAPRDALALNLYSDSRRASQWTLDARAHRDRDTAGRGISVSTGATLRPWDRRAFALLPGSESTVNPRQFVAPGVERPIVGRLEPTSVSVTTRVDLALSANLTWQVYAEPFASRGRFSDYQEVVAPRAERVSDRLSPFPAESLPASAAVPASPSPISA